MKILLVSEFFPSSASADITGGVEASVFYMAKYLALKHEVTILCSHTKNSKKVDHFNGYHVIRTGPIRSPSSDSNIARLRFVISAIKIGTSINADVIMGTNFSNHLIAYYIGKKRNIPIVLWTPDVWKGEWTKNAGIFGGLYGTFIERFNLSHQDAHYIAISTTVKKKMLAAGVPSHLIDVVHCGVDLATIKKITSTKYTLPSLVTVARLVPYKKVETILYALPIIQKKYPNVQLKIIGQGPDEKKLKRLARDLNLNKSCIFEGHVTSHIDVLRNIKSADVFCFASRTEGFGIVILEAMACSIPFVIADTPVHREVTGSKGGEFFTTGDAHDLADKVIRLLNSKKKVAKMKKEGRKWVKNFDWSIQALKIETVFQKAVKKKSL